MATQTKKRSMPVQKDSERRVKRQRPTYDQDAAQAFALKNGKSSKRSQPITHTVSDSEDEEGDEWEDDLEEEGPGEGGAIDEFEDGAGLGATYKQSTAKETHAAQKLTQQQRRAQKPNAEILAAAKRIWGAVRQKDTPKEERTKAVIQLADAVQGKVQDVVFKHDASRVIQSLVKYGNQDARDMVAQELKGRYKELAQSKYSKFLVTKLIRYSPKNRSDILAEFYGHVIRLLLHREASRVISDAFELYASSADKAKLTCGFYGKEVALFSTVESAKGLENILRDMDEAQRKRILDAVKQNLITIFNNPDKGAVTCTVVHRVLWEYLSQIKGLPDVTEETMRREVFESCHELLAEMVHTKDGSRAVREFIAQGSAKDRKAILKSLKPHVEKMCAVDEAQLVLFTALDVIDDTKLLSKSMINTITTTLPILKSPTCPPASRRSIAYLFTHRSPRHFTPAIISSIAETDEIRAQTSKKDESVRRNEVRRAAGDDARLLLEHETDLREYISNAASSLVISDLLLSGGGSPKINESLISLLLKDSEAGSLSVDDSHVSRFYKILLQGGHYSQSVNSVVISPHFRAVDFACSFVTILGRSMILEMAKGGGAFIIAELLTTLGSQGEGRDERQLVKTWFDPETLEEITTSNPKGCNVLLEKIDSFHRKVDTKHT